MTAVEYKMPENEPMHFKVNNSIVVSENQANEEIGELQSKNILHYNYLKNLSCDSRKKFSVITFYS